jgi:beta-phosphoglucomutase-like phosphatase (HAD superfamily)
MSAGRAVLWDMDGTLIDSEEFHWIAWRDTMANEGFTITRKQFLSSFGQRNDSILPRWLGAATPERIERIANAKEEQYRQLIRTNGISPLPGVVHWVRRLHIAGWLQAIASAAPRANIEAILQALSATHTESLTLKCTCWPPLVSAYRLNDVLLWKTPSLVSKERDAPG